MNITKRCVYWVLSFLKFKLPTLTISEIMGIHWNTVRKLEKMKIEYFLERKEEERKQSDYRPQYLAVDEFAIRKGHRYATCVMDLVRGDILWVGKGRSIKDFAKFFEVFEGSDYLSEVKAVAMDMNASYHCLVSQYLPNAEIVYDQYHVQAQFGRDVLGQVRLNAAREHKQNAKGLSSKEEIRNEKKLYSNVKKARWILLQNGSSLPNEKKKKLNEILNTHSDFAVCYAMKEQLVSPFQLSDPDEALEGWKKWFDAAIHSGIQPLVKFGKQKLKRLSGLVAHAKYHINTGKLEGFNNKIKVAKRNAYGFRNLNCFFSYILFISFLNFISSTRN